MLFQLNGLTSKTSVTVGASSVKKNCSFCVILFSIFWFDPAQNTIKTV